MRIRRHSILTDGDVNFVISVDEHSDENEGEVSGEKPTEVTTSTRRNGSMSHLLPFLSRPFVTTQEACSLCFDRRN